MPMSRQLDTAFRQVPCRHSAVKNRSAAFRPRRFLVPAAMVGMGQEEPFPARPMSGRGGWTAVLRRSTLERRGSADSSRWRDDDRSAQVDPKAVIPAPRGIDKRILSAAIGLIVGRLSAN